ncbi:MAG: AAA family ATPase [Oceanospirillaceae bacterium]|nr:AAA family ATPase [Oceanospirillaceae bacterium]|tara:strand:- start:6365 stop:7456 length:1092 start_codon:yes stop_codon:yes gene_type:complete
MVFANERLREQSSGTRTTALPLSRFAFSPADVAESLRQHILGQDTVIDQLEAQLNIISAGLYDTRRPLLSALFIGATGTGKTEMVRQVANAIHGRPDAFCRIDMNTLSQAHYSAAITGAPPGYVGSKENLSLFDDEAINGTSSRPGIVLFDEIEKADRAVIRALMNVLDNGTLKLASGQKSLSFHNTLVFMTSNAGSLWAERLHWLDSIPGMSRASLYQRALRRHFDTEFINRIGLTGYFSALPVHEMPELVLQLQDALNQRLQRHRLTIELDDDACRFIVLRSDIERFGARALERTFRDRVITEVARFLNSPEHLNPAGKYCLQISANHQALTFRPVPFAQGAEDSDMTFTSLTATTGENHD